jgi:hypothetical protein
MRDQFLEIAARSVAVTNAHGQRQRISIKLTPVRHFLTQPTKRAILATGFLLPYGEDFATNTTVINDVMRHIRHEVLRMRKER